MNEALVNLHMHTPFSDGSATHREIAAIAAECGLDALIVTDHNVLVQGVEGYYGEGKQRVALLTGEEVHDRLRLPQKNHLLVFGANRSLTQFAANPQQVIDMATKAGAHAYIAHPVDPALPLFGEDDISWVNWEVNGFSGIELWNGFSELKRRLRSKAQAVFYAYFPQFYPEGPLPETLDLWNRLHHTSRRPIVGLGGADAHALPMRMGPLRRTIFPYQFHFKAINNHILLENPLSGVIEPDKAAILAALASGRFFIGYDLPASTRGFRFIAQHSGGTSHMGEVIKIGNGVTFQIRIPPAYPAVCRLVRDGAIIKTWHQKRFNYTQIVNQPGVYRVECDIPWLGKTRTWILSNPIYVREN